MCINGVNNIKYVNANFIIPLPKKNSLLMSKKLSGGCFMDMGPYAAAFDRIFFNHIKTDAKYN